MTAGAQRARRLNATAAAKTTAALTADAVVKSTISENDFIANPRRNDANIA